MKIIDSCSKKLLQAMAVLMLFFTNSVFSLNDPGEEIQQDSIKNVSVTATSEDPSVLWKQYLSANGLRIGPNKKNGRFFYIEFGKAKVGKSPSEEGFIESRTAAYNMAAIQAKSNLSERLKSEMETTRGMQLFKQGEESSGAFKEIHKEISIMEKVSKLSHEHLDHQIRKFDPEWDGTGRSKEEKAKKIAKSRRVFFENLKQKSRLFIQGASPIFNAEGHSQFSRGYTVVVGMVWSPRLIRVSEAMRNPSVELDITKPGPSILEQIESKLAQNPNYLASAMGVRVWRNEKGERALVSFAAASGDEMPIIAQKKTALRARSQMAQFIAEDLVANGELGGGEVTDQYSKDSSKAYDENEFKYKVTLTAKDIHLSGAGSEYYWEGKHPNSGSMVVNVLSWSPSSQADANYMQESAVQDRYPSNKTNQKTMPSGNNNRGGTGYKTMSGAKSNPSDF